MAVILEPDTTASEAPVQQPDLGVVGTLRWLWRRLTSMRTALVLLLLLAVAAVPGSLLPQRSVDPTAVADFFAANPQLAPVLDRVGLFGVYSTPWFGAVYLLLFVSLVGCIVPRTREHVLDWRRRPPAAPSRLSRLTGHDVFEVDGTADESARRVAAALRRRGWSQVVDTEPDGTRVVAARRGRWRETGNVVFHISLLGVLLALGGSALYSWRGEAIVVEGGGFANTLPRYDSFIPGPRYDTADLPPFSLTLDALDVRFESDQAASFGAPRDFAAALSIVDTPGGAARRELVRVNQPASVDGARIYLSGNGYAPVVQVRDVSGEVIFEGAVPFLPRDGNYTSTGVVKVPGAGGSADLAMDGVFLPTAVLDETGPHSVFPDAGNPRLVLAVLEGDLGLDSGRQVSVYSLAGSDMTALRGDDNEPVSLLLAPGDTLELPGGRGSVTFVELRRFAALDVRADPSGPLALASALLVMAGLAMSLFVPYRRVWVRLTPAPADGGAARSVVGVAGQSRPRDVGLAAAVGRVRDEVRRVLVVSTSAGKEEQ